MINAEGSEETTVGSIEDVMAVVKKGQENRHVGSTRMNEFSSRSHTLLKICIESKKSMCHRSLPLYLSSLLLCLST
jgi:hypothetical protein